MRKRVVGILLVSIAAICLIASCQPGETPDETANVRFVGSNEVKRGLNRTEPLFDASRLWWKYEAVKTDDSGLMTGQTNGRTPVKTTGEAGLDGTVGPLSLGVWRFSLYGYADEGYTKLAYEGTATNVTIKRVPDGQSNTVSVKVKAGQDAKGTIAVSDAISLVDAEGHPVQNPEKVITLTWIGDGTGEQTPVLQSEEGYTEYEVTSGPWKVNVVYRDPQRTEIEYGNNTIFVNVFDNQKTYVAGALDEIRSDAGFETVEHGGVKPPTVNQEVSADSQTVISVNSTPQVQKPADPNLPVEKEKTVITVPAGELTGTEAKVDLVTYSVGTAADKFVFTSDDGSSVVGGIDVVMYEDNVKKDKFSSDVTITTYIEPQLNNVKVYYNGGTDGGKTYPSTYDPATGKLTFTTNHFSEYFITASFLHDKSWYEASTKAFTLTTPGELLGLADLVDDAVDFSDVTITLGADIDLMNIGWTPIGNPNRKLPTADGRFFSGTFDGNGHKVMNLSMKKNLDDHVYGFFGCLTGNAVIKNLTVESGKIVNTVDTAAGIAGAVIGNGGSVSIINCVNKAEIYGKGCGAGILGRGYGTGKVIISGCLNEGKVDSDDKAAGILAINNVDVPVLITGCINRGDITQKGAGTEKFAGGMVGISNIKSGLEIIDSRNEGTITANYDAGGMLGNGRNGDKDPEPVIRLTVTGCTNTGDVHAAHAGGIVGRAETVYLKIENSDNSGNIFADSAENTSGGHAAGGILGLNQNICSFGDNPTLVNCHNTGAVSSKNDAGGLIGLYGNGYMTIISSTGGNHAIGFIGSESRQNRGRLIGASSYGGDLAQRIILELDDSSTDDYSDIATIGHIISLKPESTSVLVRTGSFHGLPSVTEGSYLFVALEKGASWKDITEEKVNVLRRTELELRTGQQPAEAEVSGGHVWDTDTSWYSSEASTYEIRYASELRGFSDLVNSGIDFAGKIVNLIGDIDMYPCEWTPIGLSGRNDGTLAEGSKPFRGTFNGNGHTVTKIAVTEKSLGTSFKKPCAGFFSGLDGATVTNLTLSIMSVNGTDKLDSVGGIAGMAVNGTVISGCHVGATGISGACAGGIVGRMTETGLIDDCHVNATVDGLTGKAGGIAGAAYYDQDPQGLLGESGRKTFAIRNCDNEGSVKADNCVGGIVGLATTLDVTNCKNYAPIEGTGYGIGGIAGEFKFGGTISGCMNNGSVTKSNDVQGDYGVGGIVGWIRYDQGVEYNTTLTCSVINSQNHGNVKAGGATGVGGAVGTIYWAAVIDNVTTSGTVSNGPNGLFTGGFIGNIQPLSTYDEARHTVRIANCRNNSTCEGNWFVGHCMRSEHENDPEKIIIEVENNSVMPADSDSSTEW